MISQIIMAGGAEFDVNSSCVDDTRFSGLFKIFNKTIFSKLISKIGLKFKTK